MHPSETGEDSTARSRRRVLEALGATSVLAIAGCFGDSGATPTPTDSGRTETYPQSAGTTAPETTVPETSAPGTTGMGTTAEATPEAVVLPDEALEALELAESSSEFITFPAYEGES